MRIGILSVAFGFLFWSCVAIAQPVTVIGPITPGDCPQFSSTTVIKDGGFPCNGAPGNAITALTGDVTATGPGSVAATIAANAVTNAKAAQMPANTVKCNPTGSLANAQDCPGVGTGFAEMKPFASQGSGAWNVTDPFGNAISTTGTTCQGFDKLVAAASSNGWSWRVLGNGSISCTAPIALPTCFLKTEYIDTGVSINFSAQGSSNLMTMNSHENCQTFFKGEITQNSADTGVVLDIAPTSNDGAGNTIVAASTIQIASIAPGTGGIGVQLDPTSGSFVGNSIQIDDVNGGATGIKVLNPGSGTIVVEQNKFVLTYNHGQTTRVVQIGTSATNQSGLRYNVWHAGRIDPGSGATVAWDTWASSDTYIGLAIDSETAAAATGLKFESGSNFNTILGGIISATSDLSDGGACNSYINVKNIVTTISYFGATSGCTSVSPAAAATGNLSFPATTDTIIARATTDTLTNKTFDTGGTGNVFKINGTQVSAITGTGSAVLATSPTLVTPTLGVASATSLAASGSILSSTASGGVGYTTGSGGAVTQITSRTTGVTLNNLTGAITLFAAAPTVGTWVSFTVTDSSVAATDVPHVAFKSGTNTYIGHITTVAAGSFQISFTSIVGTASDSPVINFAVTKGSAN